MDQKYEELTLKLDYLNAKIGAQEIIIAMLLGWEAGRNNAVQSRLRMLIAGDGPELAPDMSVLPAHVTPEQRAHIEGQLAKQRKLTKTALQELATTYSLLLGGKQG
jgi:hypothetical protein